MEHQKNNRTMSSKKRIPVVDILDKILNPKQEKKESLHMDDFLSKKFVALETMEYLDEALQF